MKNIQARLHRLETRTAPRADVVTWDFASDKAFLALTDEGQAEICEIIEKMRPHLPDNVEQALMGLSDEELDKLEAFYLASDYGKREEDNGR